jgi:hypothetical protein
VYKRQVFITSHEILFSLDLAAQTPPADGDCFPGGGSALNSGSYYGAAASPSRVVSMTDDADALPLGQSTQPPPTPVNWESKFAEFLGRKASGQAKTNGELLGDLKASCDVVRSLCSAYKATLAAEISAFFTAKQVQLQNVIIDGRIVSPENPALLIEACTKILAAHGAGLSQSEIINFGQIIAKLRELDANYNLENLPDTVMGNYLKAYIWRHCNLDHSGEGLEEISSPCSHFFEGDLLEYVVAPKSILSGGWDFSMTELFLGCGFSRLSYSSPFQTIAYHPSAMILGVTYGRFTIVKIKELSPETLAAQVLESSRVEVQVYAIRDAIIALRPVIQDLLDFLK